MEDGGGKRISHPSAHLLGLCFRSRISIPALDLHWRITCRISALLVRLSSWWNAHSVVFFFSPDLDYNNLSRPRLLDNGPTARCDWSRRWRGGPSRQAASLAHALFVFTRATRPRYCPRDVLISWDPLLWLWLSVVWFRVGRPAPVLCGDCVCVQGTNVLHPRSTCLPPVSAESVKIRVKNRDPVPVYQMEMDHRDSDLEGGVVSHHLFTFTSYSCALILIGSLITSSRNVKARWVLREF